MEKAQRVEEIHQLLKEETPAGENAWYWQYDRQGKVANYVKDVARAWRIAEATWAENAAESISLQMRYALIATSLNSLAENIPPELIRALLEKKIWEPAQGLAFVRQSKEASRQAEGLKAIIEYLPPSLLPEALEVARGIGDEIFRARAIAGLALRLPEVFSEALAAAREFKDESLRAVTLAELAPHLPEIVPEALAAARGIGDESYRARALQGLMESLSSSSVDFSFWQETLHVLATLNRPHFIDNLPQLAPLILNLGGVEALRNTVSALKDVSRWWK
ncbi:MAG: hypothetical protein ACFB4I_24550 [Cyanophyceae cyanobacterium]